LKLKISGFEIQILPTEILDLACDFLRYKDQNFAAQVKYLGLEPATDFQHSDLSLVDFSNCDLRGYNFTGSNLRGCFGINVLWDASTNLTDVDADGSLFSYAIEKVRYFAAHPEDRETVQKLTREIWTNAILGVERLLQTDKGKGSSLKIAHAVFDETSSSVVRSNVLAFMRIATDSAASHKAFIFNIWCARGVEFSFEVGIAKE
jgi:Pentapeptide repeats (8 copies)